eukprot:scaffold490805_cov21-Prasinocladus_malaysianus.AAC.1
MSCNVSISDMAGKAVINRQLQQTVRLTPDDGMRTTGTEKNVVEWDEKDIRMKWGGVEYSELNSNGKTTDIKRMNKTGEDWKEVV